MKIVIINGSARKGNTLTAINAFIKGASEKNEIEIIEPTNSTLHHAGDVVSVNALRDASIRMIQILQLIKCCRRYDSFATPVYWWGMSAQLKLVIDKCYCRGLQLKK
mgnify:CR=1 FL=1